MCRLREESLTDGVNGAGEAAAASPKAVRLNAESRAGCAWYARTLVGQQTIDGRVDFREQRAEDLIDLQVLQLFDLRHVLLEIGNGVIELPKHKLSLVPKSCSDFFFIRGRRSLHR